MSENLQPILKHLTRREVAVLVRIVQLEWPERHKGMLPFLNRHDVAQALHDYIVRFSWSTRIERVIYSKIKYGSDVSQVHALSDAKIYRRFGAHPERGVTIPGIVSHHAYRTPRAFERKKDAYDVRDSMVQLKRIGSNRWVVHTRTVVYPQVLQWLDDNCGVTR